MTGNIWAKGDANLTAANIKKGVNIFGVTGTHDRPATFVCVGNNPRSTFSRTGVTSTASGTFNTNNEFWQVHCRTYNQSLLGSITIALSGPTDWKSVYFSGLVGTTQLGRRGTTQSSFWVSARWKENGEQKLTTLGSIDLWNIEIDHEYCTLTKTANLPFPANATDCNLYVGLDSWRGNRYSTGWADCYEVKLIG